MRNEMEYKTESHLSRHVRGIWIGNLRVVESGSRHRRVATIIHNDRKVTMIRQLIRSFLKMMYILTQEEMDRLVPKEELEKADKALGWARERLAPRCSRNESVDGAPYYYCDDCPLSDIGSKKKIPDRPENDISRVICKHRRSYSK